MKIINIDQHQDGSAWAEQQVAQLPAEWLQMHRAMYA